MKKRKVFTNIKGVVVVGYRHQPENLKTKNKINKHLSQGSSMVNSCTNQMSTKKIPCLPASHINYYVKTQIT